MEQKKKTFYNCSVNGCSNSTSNSEFSFFTLPVDLGRRIEWLRLMDREDLMDTMCTRSRVCEAHFTSDSIITSTNRKLLQKYSVPQLLLPQPDNSTNKETQTYIKTAEANSYCNFYIPINAQVNLNNGEALPSSCSEPSNKRRKLDNTSDCDVNDCDIDDEYDLWAKECALELRQMDPEQQIFAKRAINYILIDGRLGLLHRNTIQLNNKVQDEQNTLQDLDNGFPLSNFSMMHHGARSRLDSSSLKAALRPSNLMSKTFNTRDSVTVFSKTAPLVDMSTLLKTKACDDLGSSSVATCEGTVLPSESTSILIKLEPLDDTEISSHESTAPVYSSQPLVKTEPCDDTGFNSHDIAEPIDSSSLLVKIEPRDDTESSSQEIAAPVASSPLFVKLEPFEDTGLS